MNNFDFVVHIGTRAPEKKPNNVLNTPLANWALDEAYKWAESKADKNIFAANAKVYIESIEANREYEPREPDKADYLQLLYVIEINLFLLLERNFLLHDNQLYLHILYLFPLYVSFIVFSF